MCYIVCTGGVSNAMTTVYLHTLHDPVPTELLERGLKWSMTVRNVTLVEQRAQQALVIHKALTLNLLAPTTVGAHINP